MKKQINFAEIFEQDESHKPHLTLLANIPDHITKGKDELNFAEFPLSSISDRLDPSVKTLIFEDQITDKSTNQKITRKVMITGSDAYGLPTCTDEEVLLALVQLSKLQGFRGKRVYFNRYQLLQILRWADTGGLYKRLTEALNRWMGVTLYYKNAWRDREGAKWEDRSFHMLDTVSIKDGKIKEINGTPESSASYFEWNDVVFKSFQKGNVKDLNYDFFLTLEGSVTKRLYRFLDKRFWHSKMVELDLRTLCFEKLGISRKSPTGELKRRINWAIDELEEKNFLEIIPKEERFIKQGPGSWKVIFRRKNKKDLLPLAKSVDETLEGRLISFGISDPKAFKLVKEFPESLIEEKLKVALWMQEQKDSRVSNNPAGFLVASIEQGYQPPKQYVEIVETEQKKAEIEKIVQEQKIQKELKVTQEKSVEAKRREAIDKFLSGLSYEAREVLEEDVIEKADTGSKKMIELGGKVGESIKKVLVDKYVLGILKG